MQVKDIMTPSVECIKPDSTLDEAVEKMRTLNVGSLPICDDDRLISVITDRDITVRSVALGEDPSMDLVGDA